MTFRGVVQEGRIALPPDVQLPDGTQVRVELEEPVAAKPIATDPRPIGKKLLDFAGTVEGMPEDLAINHDHYLYGTPKR
jgi:hypothetical protein